MNAAVGRLEGCLAFGHRCEVFSWTLEPILAAMTAVCLRMAAAVTGDSPLLPSRTAVQSLTRCLSASQMRGLLSRTEAAINGYVPRTAAAVNTRLAQGGSQ